MDIKAWVKTTKLLDLKTWIRCTDHIQTAKVAAKLCGVHPQTIGNLVRGEGKGIALATFQRIATGLGLSMKELAGMCENLSVKGLSMAQEAFEPEIPVDDTPEEEVALEVPSAASIIARVVSDIPAVAEASSIQDILSRANQLESDGE